MNVCEVDVTWPFERLNHSSRPYRDPTTHMTMETNITGGVDFVILLKMTEKSFRKK